MKPVRLDLRELRELPVLSLDQPDLRDLRELPVLSLDLPVKQVRLDLREPRVL